MKETMTRSPGGLQIMPDAFSNVSAFSTKVENADMTKNFLFYRFYAFSQYFIMCPRFSLKWKMRTRLKISFLCPLSAVRCPSVRVFHLTRQAGSYEQALINTLKRVSLPLSLIQTTHFCKINIRKAWTWHYTIVTIL